MGSSAEGSSDPSKSASFGRSEADNFLKAQQEHSGQAGERPTPGQVNEAVSTAKREHGRPDVDARIASAALSEQVDLRVPEDV